MATRVLLHLVSGRDKGQTLVRVEGHRWAIEDSFETTKNELGLDHNERPLLAWLASPRLARHARLRDDGRDPSSCERYAAPKNGPPKDDVKDSKASSPLIRWSVQEIRRIAIRLAQRRINPAHVIASSNWRRVHQAVRATTHIKRNMQL